MTRNFPGPHPLGTFLIIFSVLTFVFIGHFGVAMAAKRVAPRTSLGTLVMAAQFVDLLWPIFLLLGYEQVVISPGTTAVTPLDFVSYPFSHSLLADFGWACLFAGHLQNHSEGFSGGRLPLVRGDEPLGS